MPASAPSSSHAQPGGEPSRMPAIIVNPARGTGEDVYEAASHGPARRPSDREQIASFLEALAGLVRDDIERHGPTAPVGNGAPNQSASSGLGAPRSTMGYGYEQAAGDDMMPSALLYHLMRALRNLGHFVFITSGPRGWFVIGHISKKAVVVALFALFLMFASVYRLPEVWEILFGIFGII